MKLFHLTQAPTVREPVCIHIPDSFSGAWEGGVCQGWGEGKGNVPSVTVEEADVLVGMRRPDVDRSPEGRTFSIRWSATPTPSQEHKYPVRHMIT